MKIEFRFPIALALITLALKSFAAPPVSTGSFAPVGSMRQFRKVHTATLLTNGQVLVAGGFPSISSAELFDPTGGEWSLTGSMHEPRYQQTAILREEPCA